MRAVILAAGVGSRLRPLTDETPKTLLEVSGIPILQWQAQNYHDVGVDELFVVAGHLSNQIEQACDLLDEQLPGMDVNTIINEDFAETDNIYSLYLTREYVDSDPFILSNGDAFFASEIFERATENSEEAIAFYDSTDFHPEELKLELEEGEPVSILDKGKENGNGSTIGAFVFDSEASRKLFDDLEDRLDSTERRSDWFEASLDSIFESTSFTAVDVKDWKWTEIDTEDDLKVANERFSSFSISSEPIFANNY